MTTMSGGYVGIDVGKGWLDLAIFGNEGVSRIKNNDEGITQIVTQMAQEQPQLVVVEASGGYEQALVQALQLEKVPVAVANPTRVRALAKATGKLAKTDKIDARLIAEYACKIQPNVQEPKEEREMHLRGLVTRREQLVEMRSGEQNRLGTTAKVLQEDVREHIEWLNQQITKIEGQIHDLVDLLPEWKAQADRLDTIPGVGPITAVTVVAEMPELGQLNRQQIAALAGLAPYNQDSGKKHGKRRIFGGRKGVRRVLYMACLSGIVHNPVLHAVYHRLDLKGKLFKVNITACMRKLLTIMNAMARDKLDWRQSSLS
jgi:transposase